MFKEQKGVTLIALVITIIVLLILAGVSIAMLTGDNGILTKAQSAGSETAISEIKEQVTLAINEILMNASDTTNTTTNTTSYQKATLANVVAVININTKEGTATANGDDKITYKYSDKDSYTVTLNTKTSGSDTLMTSVNKVEKK